MRASTFLVLALPSALLACGGSPARSAAPAPSAASGPDEAAAVSATATAAPSAAESAPKPATSKKALPTECDSHDGGFCTMPAKFVKRLCADNFPTVAVALFSKNAPWTHIYLRQKTKALSASSAGSSNEEMPAGEELIILTYSGSQNLGGMQVSGASGNMEALRWDGSCVTLQVGETAPSPPGKPTNARIVWNTLDNAMRDSLTEDSTVNEAFLKLRRECKGVTMGDVSKKCEEADRQVNAAIVQFVHDGGKLATPSKLP